MSFPARTHVFVKLDEYENRKRGNDDETPLHQVQWDSMEHVLKKRDVDGGHLEAQGDRDSDEYPRVRPQSDICEWSSKRAKVEDVYLLDDDHSGERNRLGLGDAGRRSE